MDIITLIGRILFGLIFLNSARSHLTNVSMLAQYSASKKVPAAKLDGCADRSDAPARWIEYSARVLG